MGVCGSRNYYGVQPTRIVSFGKGFNLGSPTAMVANLEHIHKNKKELQEDKIFLKNSQRQKIDGSKDYWTEAMLKQDKILEGFKKDYDNLQKPVLLEQKGYYGHLIAESDRFETFSNHGNKFVSIQRTYFSKFETLISVQTYLIKLKQLEISNLLLYESTQIIKKDDHYVFDRINHKPFHRLLDVLRKDGYKPLSDPIRGLKIVSDVADILCKLHAQGFSYRALKPENIIFVDEDRNGQPSQEIYLQSPTFFFEQREKYVFTRLAENNEHYYIEYDNFCLCLLPYALLVPESDFNALKMIETQDEVDELIKVAKDRNVPPILIDLFQYLIRAEKNELLTADIISRSIKAVISKGPQTKFMQDSIGAYLSYNLNKPLPFQEDFIYLVRKNQIHLYEFSREALMLIKLFKKKRKFFIKTQITFNPTDDSFYFFASNISNKSVKVTIQRLMLSQLIMKSEVDFFKTLRGVQVEDPLVKTISVQPGQTDFYIFNNKRQHDPKTQDPYYNSYIIQIKEVTNTSDVNWENEQETLKRQDSSNSIQSANITIYEGPRNYQWHKEAFYFYDPYLHYFYTIPDCMNIFQNGIRYGAYNTAKSKGDFRESVLKFACGEQAIFENFSNMVFRIDEIDWIVPAQKGVFLMHASKNIFILDFNFECFYSLASIEQLENYERNKLENPLSYMFAYEIRKQPFEVKYPLQNRFGKSVIFMNGQLHMLVRKEIETILCSYKLLCEQGALELDKCISLYSNKEITREVPMSVGDVAILDQVDHKLAETKDFRFKVGEYRVISKITEKDGINIYRCCNRNGVTMVLRCLKVNSLRDFEYSRKIFEKRLKYKYLLRTHDLILTKNENEDNFYYINFVQEMPVSNLESEINEKKRYKMPFQPKEIAYILKVVLKGVIELHDKGIEHGNLNPSNVCFMVNGQTKIQGYLAKNIIEWQNDWADAVTVLHSCVTLTVHNKPIFIKKLNEEKQLYDAYPGLFTFLQKLLQQSSSERRIDLPTLKTNLRVLIRSLQAENLNVNKFQTSQSRLFWIHYTTNSIYSANALKKLFSQTIVYRPEGGYFKFSKYSMFCVHKNTFYISGSYKEEIEHQSFYSVNFGKYKNGDEIKATKLAMIPAPILSPSMLYSGGYVYCFGGFLIHKNGSKQVTNLCFQYSVNKKQFKQIASLPVNLVNSTALQSTRSKNKIYLFGGYSDQIDLSGRELNYFEYDVDDNVWAFKTDFGLKSPFMNSRLVKPMIDILQDDLFISFKMVTDKESQKESFEFQLFELKRGGINLKFKYNPPENAIQDDLNNIDDIFAKNEFTDKSDLLEKRFLQDDLSFLVIKDKVYHMHEKTRDLLIFSFDLQKVEVQLETIKYQAGDEEQVDEDALALQLMPGEEDPNASLAANQNGVPIQSGVQPNGVTPDQPQKLNDSSVKQPATQANQVPLQKPSLFVNNTKQQQPSAFETPTK